MLAFPGFPRSMIDTILDDEFDVHPMELLMPRAMEQINRANGQLTRGGFPFATPTIKNNKYSLNLDLHQFAPEEVKVQFDENKMLRISGKHEEKSEDGTRYEFREYVQHFSVPENVQHDKLSVKLDKNGHLAVEGPLKDAEEAIEDGVKNIPIEFVKEK